MASALTSKGSTWQWRKTRARILRRDQHICQYCGAYADTVDHRLPRRMGGGDEDGNLVACCRACQHPGDRSSTTHSQSVVSTPLRSVVHKSRVVFKRAGAADMPLSPISLPYTGTVTRDYTAPGRPGRPRTPDAG